MAKKWGEWARKMGENWDDPGPVSPIFQQAADPPMSSLCKTGHPDGKWGKSTAAVAFRKIGYPGGLPQAQTGHCLVTPREGGGGVWGPGQSGFQIAPLCIGVGPKNLPKKLTPVRCTADRKRLFT